MAVAKTLLGILIVRLEVFGRPRELDKSDPILPRDLLDTKVCILLTLLIHSRQYRHKVRNIRVIHV